jgi:hypothetical protein
MLFNSTSRKEREEVMELYHSEGGLDLIAGTVLLNLGLDLLNNSSTTSLFTWIPILLYSSIKSRYSLPRIGYDALKADEKIVRSWNAQTAVSLAIALLVLGTIIVGDPLGLQTKINLPLQGNVICLAFGLIGGLFALLAARFIPLKRLYIYAGVIFSSGLISYFFLPIQVPVFLSAIVIIVIGFRLTMAFNKKYPDPEKDQKIIDVKEKKKK